MQGTIEVIASTGKGFRIVGQNKGEWFNKGKMLDEDIIPSLKKGDSVEFTAQGGKWITDIKKLSADVVVPPFDPTIAPQPSEAVKKVFSPVDKSAGLNEKSNSIARGCAANAVLGSTFLPELLVGGCNEETVQNIKNFMEQVAEFVYGGKWK